MVIAKPRRLHEWRLAGKVHHSGATHGVTPWPMSSRHPCATDPRTYGNRIRRIGGYRSP